MPVKKFTKTLLALIAVLVAVQTACTAPVEREMRTAEAPRDEAFKELREEVRNAFERKAYRQCKILLRRMIARQADSVEAWYNLACAQSRLGELDDAAESLERAIDFGYDNLRHMEKDPDLAALRKQKAYHRLRGRLERKPSRTRTTRRRGEPTSEPKGAEDEPGAIHKRVIALFHSKKYAQCEPLLRKILELDPNNSTAYYNLGCMHARLGQSAEALTALNKALDHGYAGFHHLERDPDLESLRRLRGYRELLKRRDAVQRSRAERISTLLRDKLDDDEGYLHRIDHDARMVFATNTDEQTLADLQGYLTRYAEAQWRDLFEHGFDEYVTIIIPRKWKLRRIGGYYTRSTHMLKARNIGMTLTHEFTHALHNADQSALGQRHPIWVTEGLATLFESSRLIGGSARPEPNRRINLLKRIVRKGKHVPLGKLVKLSQRKFMRNSAVCYPQVRGVMYYLHSKGVLKRWYDRYKATFHADRTGAAALEAVLGKPLERIEDDWLEWVRDLEGVPTRLPERHAYLGIRVATATDGLKVADVVSGSGAHNAGLRRGDVIYRIDGNRVLDNGGLIRLVSECEVGQRVTVRYRRGEDHRRTEVTLGAMPSRRKLMSADD